MTDIEGVAEGVEAVTLNKSDSQENDIVDPWNVASSSDTGIDYDKLISKLHHISKVNNFY